jgi:hypothetical protein
MLGPPERVWLNVVRAENYRGKSQLVQSIIYALGLEVMRKLCFHGHSVTKN